MSTVGLKHIRIYLKMQSCKNSHFLLITCFFSTGHLGFNFSVLHMAENVKITRGKRTRLINIKWMRLWKAYGYIKHHLLLMWYKQDSFLFRLSLSPFFISQCFLSVSNFMWNSIFHFHFLYWLFVVIFFVYYLMC